MNQLPLEAPHQTLEGLWSAALVCCFAVVRLRGWFSSLQQKSPLSNNMVASVSHFRNLLIMHTLTRCMCARSLGLSVTCRGSSTLGPAGDWLWRCSNPHRIRLPKTNSCYGKSRGGGGGAETPVWSCNFGTIILRLRCTLIQTPSDLKVKACLKAHVEISRARFEGWCPRRERSQRKGASLRPQKEPPAQGTMKMPAFRPKLAVVLVIALYMYVYIHIYIYNCPP